MDCKNIHLSASWSRYHWSFKEKNYWHQLLIVVLIPYGIYRAILSSFVLHQDRHLSNQVHPTSFNSSPSQVFWSLPLLLLPKGVHLTGLSSLVISSFPFHNICTIDIHFISNAMGTCFLVLYHGFLFKTVFGLSMFLWNIYS